MTCHENWTQCFALSSVYCVARRLTTSERRESPAVRQKTHNFYFSSTIIIYMYFVFVRTSHLGWPIVSSDGVVRVNEVVYELLVTSREIYRHFNEWSRSEKRMQTTSPHQLKSRTGRARRRRMCLMSNGRCDICDSISDWNFSHQICLRVRCVCVLFVFFSSAPRSFSFSCLLFLAFVIW